MKFSSPTKSVSKSEEKSFQTAQEIRDNILTVPVMQLISCREQIDGQAMPRCSPVAYQKNDYQKMFPIATKSKREIKTNTDECIRTRNMFRCVSEKGRKSDLNRENIPMQRLVSSDSKLAKHHTKPDCATLLDLIDSGKSVHLILENEIANVALFKSMTLKKNALQKAKEGQWKKSHDMLHEISIFEKKCLVAIR